MIKIYQEGQMKKTVFIISLLFSVMLLNAQVPQELVKEKVIFEKVIIEEVPTLPKMWWIAPFASILALIFAS